MPRKASDERLDTRAARERLAVRHAPYWRNIQEGRAVGYRRAETRKAGQWQARFLDRDEAGVRVRKFVSLGTADDLLDSDGIDTLNFAQAQEKARAWFAELTRTRRGVAEPMSIAEAVAAYLADYKARGGKDAKGLETTINAHILPKLGEIRVSDLTFATLRAWHRALATTARRIRLSKKPGAKKPAPKPIDSNDTEALRARRASANRILTVLKAALNLAHADGKVTSDDAWRRITPFKNVDAARVRYLTDDEAKRLVNGADWAFRPMVQAALLTGCRYGELCRLRVADFNPETRMIYVRVSKGGKARHVTLIDEGKAFFTGQCAGKTDKSPILTNATGLVWGKSWQVRPIQAASAAVQIMPAVNFNVLRHTHASRLAMAGVPMAVIAAQLGNSEAICAKHYAHLSPGYVSDSIRAAFTPLGIVAESKVVPLRGA